MLTNTKVILASASPRRSQLFDMLGLKPLVIPSAIEEPVTSEKPHLQAMRHAKRKALAVAAKMDPACLVIGADTIVVMDGVIYGKPESRVRAAEYLKALSGRTHSVYTGLGLVYRNRVLCAYERSSVSFAEISEEDIDQYIRSNEPMDKAGAYGIQGYGSQFISGIRGCYFNVMGFPIHLFYKMLKEIQP
jgi:septum formation protein